MKTSKMKRFLVALLTVCTLLTQGNMVAFAATGNAEKTTTSTGVELYENESLKGQYANINAAFGQMTNTTAHYTVVLNSDQELTGYAQWPTVGSITIKPVDTESKFLRVKETNITFNSNVMLSNSIFLQPSNTNTSAQSKLNLQGYELSFDWEGTYFYPTVGNIATGVGFDISGTTGSKITSYTQARLYYTTVDIDELELVYGTNGVGGLTFFESKGDSSIGTVDTGNCEGILQMWAYDGYQPSLEIGMVNFTEATGKLLIDLYDNVEVEVKEATSTTNLTVTYQSKEAIYSSVFKYTGNTEPCSIRVQCNNDRTYAVEAKDAYKKDTTNTTLLYAPNISSDVISFKWNTTNRLTSSSTAHNYSYTGSLPSTDGYYYSNSIPEVVLDKAFYVVDEGFSDTLSYSVSNTTDLENYVWEMSPISPESETYNSTVTSYDDDSVSFTYETADKNSVVVGDFYYASGSIQIVIPILLSPSASQVKFTCGDRSVVTLATQWDAVTLELDYVADDTPVTVVTTDTPDDIENLSVDGKTVTFYVRKEGSYVLHAYVGGEVVECTVVVTIGEYEDGWNIASDGNWYYYKDGQVDTTVNGIVYNVAVAEYWYAVNGKADFTVTTVAAYGKGWWYVKDGKIDFTYFGIGSNSLGDWYIKNGQVNFNINGLAQCGASTDWYYFKNGAVQKVTGLYQNSYGWWYVKNGKIDFTYTGLASNSYGYWYVKDGKIDFTYFGLAENGSGTWYVKNGQVNFKINGLAQCGSDWYYFKNGAVQFVDTVASNNMGWWYVNNGKVDFTYDGVGTNAAGTWYCENGKVDFSKSGVLLRGGVWYYFKNGAVQFVDTVASNSMGWWVVKNGVVDFTFDGIAENGLGLWYCVDSKVDFNFNGTVDFEGHTYKVVNGKATIIQ